jgi:hypothetical protein
MYQVAAFEQSLSLGLVNTELLVLKASSEVLVTKISVNEDIWQKTSSEHSNSLLLRP